MALKLLTNSVCKVIKAANLVRSPSAFHKNLNIIGLPAAINSQAITMPHFFSTNIPEIATYEEIKQLPKKPETLLIDVREPQELAETGVVPTSINIPLSQVTEKLSKDFSEKEFQKIFDRKKPSLDTEIIFMCKIGGRSHNAMEQTRKLGYRNVRNYLGSWQDWSANEGLKK